MNQKKSEKTNTELLIEAIQSNPDAILAYTNDKVSAAIFFGLELHQSTDLYVAPVKESFDPSVLNKLQSRIYESFYNKSEESKTRKWGIGDFKRAYTYSSKGGFLKMKETSRKLHFGRFEIYELLDLSLNVTYDITVNDTYLQGMIEKVIKAFSSNSIVCGNNIQPEKKHYESLQQDGTYGPYHGKFNRETTLWMMPSEEYVKNMLQEAKPDFNSDYPYFKGDSYSVDLLNKGE